MVFLISLILAAFAQPGWIPALGPIAAACGYALFWRGVKDKPFLRALIWAIAVELIRLSWMTSIEYQGIYILFIALFLALFVAVQFAFVTQVLFSLKGSIWIRSLAAASLWALFEWGRQRILCGYSLNPVGLSLASTLTGAQGVSVVGILGLSFWVIWTNALLFLGKQRVLIPAAILILIPYVFGAARLFFTEHEEGKTLAVGLMQTGLYPDEKMPFAGKEGKFFPIDVQFKRMYKEVDGKKLDLLVFPEAAFPFGAERPLYPKEWIENFFPGVSSSKPMLNNIEMVQSLSNYLNVRCIAGFDIVDNERFYNSALFFQPGSHSFSRYDKRVLLPLAEYLPFPFLMRFTKAYGLTAFFSHGKGPAIFQGDGISYLPSICYEETFSHIVRKNALGHLLVNISNDGWYPKSRLPMQHFSLGKLRAIELGLPLVRCCNTGITAAIDPLGRVIASREGRPLMKEGEWGLHVVDVPIKAYPTLYKLIGDWPLLIVSGAILVIALAQNRKKKINLF